MLHEVRVYDGQGNLKKIIKPKMNYEAKPICGGKEKKVCANQQCKKTTIMKGNQKYCHPNCAREEKLRLSKVIREAKKKFEKAKPIVPCGICEEPVTGTRIKYCSEVCDQKARKLKSKKKQEETNARIKIRREELKNEQTQTA